MATNFEDFETIFGEAKPEWETAPSNLQSLPLKPFLFRVFAVDPSHLRFHATDFAFYTWEATRSLHQLEDMWYQSSSSNQLNGTTKRKLAHTRNLTAMEEALKAILEEQKGWLQQQIEWQNASIAAHHQQVLEQQQQNMREQQLWINQQNQLLMTQIVAQLEQDRERGKGRPHPVNLASKERDSTGIGGSWLDFMNYVRSSLRSKDVKLVLEWQSNSNGAKYAKLVARKSKGLPLISISLSKLSNSAASEAMASLSLELFKAYTVLHDSFIKVGSNTYSEQERCCQLSREISAEKEKSQAIKRKLDAALHSESQRSQKTSDMGNIASPFDSDTSSVTAVLNSSEKQPAAEGQSTKVTSRVVPAHRRAKVRGAILHDAEDEEGS